MGKWEIDGETVVTVTDFIFLGSKITVDGDHSHKITRCLLLGRKTITNLDSMLKSRDIILSTKVNIVKCMVFPAVMYRCESWNIEKAQHWRNDAFELWCWRRLLRAPWTARRPNQSILNEFTLNIHWRDDLEAETPILWPPDVKSWLTGRGPDAWKDWGQKEKGMTEDEMVGQHHWLNGHESGQAQGDGKRTGSLACCSPWCHKESDMTRRLNRNNSEKFLNLILAQIFIYL